MAQLVRFFAEEGADWCLWGEEEDPGSLERALPLPEVLRARMRAWIGEFNARVQEGDPGQWTQGSLEEFDRRGYALSREVQDVLDSLEAGDGQRYRVRYGFLTSEVRSWASSAGDDGEADMGADGDRDAVYLSAPGELSARRLGELLRAIAVLALPAHQQVGWLEKRGAPVSGRGLVIDVYEAGPLASRFVQAKWITTGAGDRVVELVRALNDMSGPDNVRLWTRDALFDAPPWEEVRRLAIAVLAQV